MAVLEFKPKDAEPTEYAMACPKCGGGAFLMMEDGSIVCFDEQCDHTQHARWFYP